MINQLRKKLFVMMMCLLTMVLVSTIIFINLFVKNNGAMENTKFLNDISRNGRIPSGEMYHEIDERESINLSKLDFAPTFLIKVDDDMQVLDIQSNNHSFSDEIITSMVCEILENPSENGTLNEWEYVFRQSPEGNNLVLRNMEYTIHELANRTMLISSLIFGGCGLILLAIVCLFLSYFVSKPVMDAFDRQKQFISDASHELKTPISIISLNASILQEEDQDNPQLNYIQQQAQRMDALVKELLNSSKLEAKGYKINKKFEDISSLIYEVTLPFESVAYEKGIKFHLSIQENVMGKIDAEKLQQVFMILVDNAVKYATANTEINISFQQIKRKKVFTIENHGERICEDDLKHLFERFYKVDKSRVQDGSYGLGLSIAKEIVVLHRGKISVTSDELGCTKFMVVL